MILESIEGLSDVAIIGLFIFIGTYILISSEKFHRPVASLLGASLITLLLVAFGQNEHGDPITFHEITMKVEWNTILFITSMMIITIIASQSGLFQYLSIHIVRLTKGRPVILFYSFVLVTFIISLIFDVITTMLIIAPLTIEIYNILEYDIKPVLIAEAVTTGFGSIPSLVGSVPNIVLGEKAGFTFVYFFLSLAPLAIIMLLISIPLLWLISKKQIKSEPSSLVEEIFLLDPYVLVENKRTFYASIIGLGLLVIGFVTRPLDLKSAEIALFVAALLMAASGLHPEEVFKKIEWISIYFIIGLFILVGSIEILGILDLLGVLLEPVMLGNPVIAIIFILIVVSFLSAVIDNIPVSAALGPVFLGLGVGNLDWLALIVAVNVGGYILPIGSPANILAINMSGREGNAISFVDFLKIGATVGIVHLIVAIVYFLLFGSIIA